MRAFPATTADHHSPSYLSLLQFPSSPSSTLPPNLSLFPFKVSQTAPKLFSHSRTNCSSSLDNSEGINEDTQYSVVDSDGVVIEVEKMGRNWRRVRSRISISASLEAIWTILTDYDRLSDIVPGLAVSKLVEKRDNCARIYQVGQQNFPLGLKFRAKAVLDCYEKELEILATGRKRDIEFKMIEGDFQLYEGKWSIEQFNKPRYEESLDQEFESTLSYFVDVKPQPWLPFRLIEGILCKEIKTNLSCVREEAQRVNSKTSTM